MTKKQRRGRPRKRKGRIELWQFARAAKIICAYEETRARGEKHGAAISRTVELVTKDDPDIRVSETEVRRTLAAFRPRNAKTILRFKRAILTKKGITRIRRMLAQVPNSEGLLPPPAPNDNSPIRGTLFEIRFGKRPNYPRYNRKNSSE